MSDDYKGMSDEAAKEYEKRQAEPLFKTAKSMIPEPLLKEHYDNLLCGYHKRDGCMVIVRDVSFYACLYHQAMQATGTDFFMYYKLLTDNDLERMTSQQHTKLQARRQYMQRWMDNFPRGA